MPFNSSQTVTCIIFQKKDDYFYDVYRLSGNISDTLNKGIIHLNDLMYQTSDKLFLILVPYDTHLDQVVDNEDSLLEYDPVIKLYNNKSIEDYEYELDNLKDLRDLISLKSETLSVIFSYEMILASYNNFIECNLDKDLINKFVKILKNSEANPFVLLNYICSKKDLDEKDIINMIYSHLGLNLIEFKRLIRTSSQNTIDKLLNNFYTKGKIKTIKNVLFRTLKVWH